MRRETLDTNVLLRLMDKGELPDQHKAARMLIEKASVRYFVSDVVLFEFVHVLDKHYQHSRKEIQFIVEALAGVESIDCNAELTKTTLELYCAHSTLSYADCYLAASADYMNALPLWTFDKDLAKRVDMAQLLDVA
ncbi:MAG: PIN domain-containing protein [Coriobacteriia bacterium]|nr:PIN domain-containing protein [Coriobacteriia bacterium]